MQAPAFMQIVPVTKIYYHDNHIFKKQKLLKHCTSKTYI